MFTTSESPPSSLRQLDNPVWHALTGPQSRFAEGTGEALRFPAAVSPFTAMPDEAGASAWEELRALVGPGGMAALLRTEIVIPEGWQVLMRFPCRQMVCTRPAFEGAGVPEGDVTAGSSPEALSRDDRDAMLELTKRTEPGPFGPRTHELGRYIGFRGGGRLAAMAGERLRIPGATEISAVCTDPAYRRRGLAATLVIDLAGQIVARREMPFLHVLATNTSAIRIYQALGFETRMEVDVVALRAPR